MVARPWIASLWPQECAAAVAVAEAAAATADCPASITFKMLWPLVTTNYGSQAVNSFSVISRMLCCCSCCCCSSRSSSSRSSCSRSSSSRIWYIWAILTISSHIGKLSRLDIELNMFVDNSPSIVATFIHNCWQWCIHWLVAEFWYHPVLRPGQHDPQPKRTDSLSPLLHISERESMTLES